MKYGIYFFTMITIAAASGCVPGPDGKTKERTKSTVQGLFVSGHLGNYLDCPGDGYTEDGERAESSGAASKDADFAPCPPDEECNYELNCEDAQMTFQLSNEGTSNVGELQIEKIELLDEQMNPIATLPLIALSDVDEGQTFDGDIETGETLDLRLDFQGPARPYDLMKTDSGYIKLTISGDEHPAIIIESTELYTLPSVVT